METYNFDLENILEWRIGIEKEVVEKFAEVQRELEEQKNILNKLIREHQTAIEDKRFGNIHEMQQRQLYIEDLQDKMDSKEVLISQTSNKFDETRKRLLDAQKDRKVMEKLKERDWEEYLDVKKSTEQKQLDEIAILNYQKSLIG